MDPSDTPCLSALLRNIRLVLALAAGLFFIFSGSSHAAILLAIDDNYGIPASRILRVEPFGVLENDTLDDENAGENGVTTVLLSSVTKGTLMCPGVGPGLCEDGSFEYRPNAGFDGEDSFVYQATSATETSAPATVTLSACSGGPQIFSCWNEPAYLAKLAELGYSTFPEGFEGTVWDVARSPYSAGSVTSQGVIWTSNHTATNNITTGSGPARTGTYGVFDPDHGIATGTPGECDVDAPPAHCLYHDGFSGSLLTGVTALHGVGGYITGTYGANPAIILDGTTQVGFSQVFDYQFIGVIDAGSTGFTRFEFRELDGKTGQALYIFGDDFILAGVPLFPDGDIAPWGNPDGQINGGDLLIATQLVLGLRTPGPLQYAHGDMNLDGAIDPADMLLIQQLALQ